MNGPAAVAAQLSPSHRHVESTRSKVADAVVTHQAMRRPRQSTAALAAPCLRQALRSPTACLCLEQQHTHRLSDETVLQR